MVLSDMFKKKSSEYYLENAVEQNRKNPRSFLIPTAEEIEYLKEGNLVKLIFVMNEPIANGCRAERMWVKITDTKNNRLQGVLDNHPSFLKTIKYGDKLSFEAVNIASVLSSARNINEELYAVISKKALELKQINWVIRTTDLNNPKDSGWQLFYGDESQDYLDNAQNATIIKLRDVLSFEPLLEYVFSNDGYSYEYSDKLKRYIVV
jgi:hypothetical protein